MTLSSHTAEQASKHPLAVWMTLGTTVIQMAFWLFDLVFKTGIIPTVGLWKSILLAAFGGAATLLAIAVVRILGDNKRLREVFAKLHDLNHLYRETLAKTSSEMLEKSLSPEQKQKRLLEIERETLTDVARLVSSIFSSLTRTDVAATVWLYMPTDDSCREYVSSQDRIDAKRSLSTDAFKCQSHTYFKDCLKKKGKLCHYLSRDLDRSRDSSDGYEDQRPSYGELYQSIMTVPIRFSTAGAEDKMGYLQIDTKSRYKLNDTEHLYLLGAFADQIYNFMSLLRRNYFFN